MKQTIQDKIKALEQEYQIKVLLACETGSRGWGFPSPDSDFDVRLLYSHSADWYLSLQAKKDTIEWMSEDRMLDITGWDLKKALQLLYKSNSSFFERIQSTIIYQADTSFLDEVRALAPEFFSAKASLHHYLKLAQKAFDEVKGKDAYKLKRLFYALRASLACRWILEKGSIPPLVMTEMIEELELEPSLKKRMKELIELKLTKDETYLHNGENWLFHFIEESIQLVLKKQEDVIPHKGDLKSLDAFFLKTIKAL